MKLEKEIREIIVLLEHYPNPDEIEAIAEKLKRKADELHEHSKEILISELKKLKNKSTDIAHQLADDLLIEYIDDEDIKNAYEDIKKWYS